MKAVPLPSLIIWAILVWNVTQAATVSRPRCEYLENPLGLEVRQPRLSWVMGSEIRDDRRTLEEPSDGIYRFTAPDLLP